MKRVFLYAVPLLLGAFAVMSRTPPEASETLAQGDQEEIVVDETLPDTVTDEQLQVYIDVYSAMQMDHSLTLEDAIVPHHLTMDEFRSIERRVQNKSRLVTKVRAALLEQATKRSAFSEPRGATSSAAP